MKPVFFPKGIKLLFEKAKKAVSSRLPENTKTMVTSFSTLLARDFSTLLIQTFYFLLLANTLTLANMGIFAAILSVGMIIGSTMGLGYEELSYRNAVQKPRLLGSYLAGTYFALAMSLPAGLAVSVLIYFLVFASKVSLISFLEVMAVELLLWRIIEIYSLLNEGLGHFGKIMKIFILSYTLRAIAALVFWQGGYTDLELWIHFYLFANSLAFLAVWTLYRPKVRLRLHIPIVLSQLGHSAYMSFTRLMYALQREIDKVIILVLAGNEATGIYTISIRILALISMPVQAFFALYMRKMLKQKSMAHIMRNNLAVEAVIFSVIIIGFLLLMQILHIAPNLLGKNVAAANFFYSGLIVLPAFKLLIEFHSEMYFAFNHIKDRALASVIISVMRVLAMVLTVIMAGTIANWPFWMNISFALLYFLSLAMVYPVIIGRYKNIPALLGAMVSRFR